MYRGFEDNTMKYESYKNSLLLNEHPMQLLPHLSRIIGLNEAIILQQIHYWILNKRKNNQVHFEEGREWVYNTVSAWQRQFVFLSVKTIERALKKLIQKNLLIAKALSKNKNNRTLYYSINYSELFSVVKKDKYAEMEYDNLTEETCQKSHCQIDPIECDNMSKCTITEITTEITKYINAHSCSEHDGNSIRTFQKTSSEKPNEKPKNPSNQKTHQNSPPLNDIDSKHANTSNTASKCNGWPLKPQKKASSVLTETQIAEFRQEMIESGCDEDKFDYFIQLRKNKRLPLTNTAIKLMKKAGEKADMTLAQTIEYCADCNWGGFTYDYYQKRLIFTTPTTSYSNNRTNRTSYVRDHPAESNGPDLEEYQRMREIKVVDFPEKHNAGEFLGRINEDPETEKPWVLPEVVAYAPGIPGELIFGTDD